jgi:hypothetical protein
VLPFAVVCAVCHLWRCLQDHAVYYAGPAKTPEGYASGSFGPTTAGRMDAYVHALLPAPTSYQLLPAPTSSYQLLPAPAFYHLLPSHQLALHPTAAHPVWYPTRITWQVRRRLPGSGRFDGDACQGQPLEGRHEGLQDARRLLPRVHWRCALGCEAGLRGSVLPVALRGSVLPMPLRGWATSLCVEAGLRRWLSWLGCVAGLLRWAASLGAMAGC